jgi:hypothetical protein
MGSHGASFNSGSPLMMTDTLEDSGQQQSGFHERSPARRTSIVGAGPPNGAERNLRCQESHRFGIHPGFVLSSLAMIEPCFGRTSYRDGDLAWRSSVFRPRSAPSRVFPERLPGVGQATPSAWSRADAAVTRTTGEIQCGGQGTFGMPCIPAELPLTTTAVRTIPWPTSPKASDVGELPRGHQIFSVSAAGTRLIPDVGIRLTRESTTAGSLERFGGAPIDAKMASPRASDFGSDGRGFESLRARHFS